MQAHRVKGNRYMIIYKVLYSIKLCAIRHVILCADPTELLT